MNDESSNASAGRRRDAAISVAALIASIPEPAVIVDLEGRVLVANPRFSQAVGARVEELIGADAFAFPILTAIARRRTVISEAVGTREAALLEEARGGASFVHTIRPVLGEAGEPEALMIVVRDVTERVRVVEALRTSESRFRSIFENANVGIASTDVTGRVIEFNDVFVSMLGYSAAELRSMNFADFTHPDDLAVEAVLFAEVLAGKRDRYHMEKRYLAKDGRHLWVDIFVSTLRDDAGRVTTFVAVIADITARKSAEASLREKEAQLVAVFDNISECVILLGVDVGGGLRVAAVNEFFVRTLSRAGLSVSRAQMIGRTPEELGNDVLLLRDDDVNACLGRLKRAIETGKSDSAELTIPAPARRHVFDTTVTPIFDDGGRPAYVLWTATDITDKREAEAALRASLAEKETLLGEIHHRVRNNLQVISSLLSLQGNNVDDPRQQAAFRESKDRIRTMALVHERLYRSSNFAAIDWNEHVGELARMIAASQPDRAELDVQFGATPIHVGIDVAIPLGLIVNELVTNAFKHAYPQGTRGVITVACRHGDGALLVTVSDQGIGLAPDFQLETRKSLGLKLVRSLAEQIQATIDLRSGAGTTVTIAVPHAPAG